MLYVLLLFSIYERAVFLIVIFAFLAGTVISFLIFRWKLNRTAKEIQSKTEKVIGQNIHDELGALATIVRLQIQSIDQAMDSLLFRETRSETLQNIDLIIQEIRNFNSKQAPFILQKQGLINSINKIGSFARIKGIRFEFMTDLKEYLLTENAKQGIFYIIHECINNSLKHSNCNNIQLGIKAHEDQLVIIYYDNGKFKNMTKSSDTSSGINNILRRVEELNGKVHYKNNFYTGSFYHIFLNNNYIYSKVNHYENYA